MNAIESGKKPLRWWIVIKLFELVIFGSVLFGFVYLTAIFIGSL